ncbi:hypothetical protein THAOC_11680 [Thalassiosira oceanica]|uniref:RING-type domain-containing protein n=1 Tax=Thalassiosira oceanica TaxID=159749 RepID=K0T9V8_THAOC|nr:hypothetical protein THAOC_11680 [Thalassiosira oceanica]|eukprot:EJK67307.1 hypothetical protein THAOC_11680 [Thalassiosira oceanica]
MAETGDDAVTAVTELTCGICLEESKDPLSLPCGHSFCAGCLDEWRSRYGVYEEMRRKCPICRARIPPSKDMVTTLQFYQADKQMLEDNNQTSSERYRIACRLLAQAEKKVGADWDGVTVLEDNNNTRPVVIIPDYIYSATFKGDIKSVLRWISLDRTEDRANATSKTEMGGLSALQVAAMGVQPVLHWNSRVQWASAKDTNEVIRLLLSWGASFFSEGVCPKRKCVDVARNGNEHEIADLLESELGGRRCEIVNLSPRPKLNGKTCVADEYLPGSDQYRVTLETKSREALILDPENLRRRDRTPQDCGYYIEFRNGRTIRHDFDSSEDCQAFVSALTRGEERPAVTEEAEARAEQAAAELLAELGLDGPPSGVLAGDEQAGKPKKKKKGGKKKKKKK